MTAEDKEEAAAFGFREHFNAWTHLLSRKGGPYHRKLGRNIMIGVRITRKEVMEVLLSPIESIEVEQRS